MMTEVEEQLFAAALREAFMEVALAGWKARDMNISDQRTLEVLAPTMEPLVQSIVRRAAAS